ncbi:MAG: hypothetical protein F6J98_23840 [Moorea sp. SIO4G2]|uniref:hypothetical protein n=1 Tax=Moorena sp. SIO3F7 TaxID=2607839 RepID=UPI0013F97BF9|nr:hypothetical protein [Moorena sp. SIO3F7]NEO50353.1 hypothetical protein [Moorena sp. SIO4A3]NEO63301.1 hypothetical protein [Moorena sp. SIO4G2]NEP98406.1 hypothetical protein [Moorena sp. SIO3F7]
MRPSPPLTHPTGLLPVPDSRFPIPDSRFYCIVAISKRVVRGVRGVRKTIAAMQRGLGGSPHERLHQDTVTISR